MDTTLGRNCNITDYPGKIFVMDNQGYRIIRKSIATGVSDNRRGAITELALPRREYYGLCTYGLCNGWTLESLDLQQDAEVTERLLKSNIGRVMGLLLLGSPFLF
jgi:hypothetical protein